ncbi:MAG: fibronectin type III domain-containing protein [Phycisphaera sp. RhM]|nr:fibronectin type III domain-containing protein [Phycisphaera sp. RhM]
MDLLTESYGYGDIARRVAVLGAIGLVALSQILRGYWFGRLSGFVFGSRRDHDRDIIYPKTWVRGTGDGFWWAFSCYVVILVMCGYVACLLLPNQHGPPNPRDLTAICTERLLIQLTWSAPDREVGPSSYIIFRDTKPLPPHPSEELRLVVCHGLSYPDRDVEPSTRYYYCVAADYRWEKLAFSDEATDQTP